MTQAACLGQHSGNEAIRHVPGEGPQTVSTMCIITIACTLLPNSTLDTADIDETGHTPRRLYLILVWIRSFSSL